MDDARAFAQFKAQWIKNIVPELNNLGIQILDFGCGDGLMTYYLQEVFFQAQVIGVDRESVINKAREPFLNIPFISFLDKSFSIDTQCMFDALIISCMLHHLTDQQQDALLKAIAGYLKLNGIVVILEFNPYALPHIGKSIKQICSEAHNWVSYTRLKKMLERYEYVSSCYSCFFPEQLGFLASLEPWLSSWPFGSLAMHRWQKGLCPQD